MVAKKRWSDLTSRQRRAIVGASIVEVGLTIRALLDLARRPAGEVRGSKLLWFLGCFVQPIGPVAYLAIGRRKP